MRPLSGFRPLGMLLAALTLSFPALAAAQQPPAPAAEPAIRLDPNAARLSSLPRQPTAMELRQARALERARHRAARLEFQAWMGYSALRPPVPANPYTHAEPSPTVLIFVPMAR